MESGSSVFVAVSGAAVAGACTVVVATPVAGASAGAAGTATSSFVSVELDDVGAGVDASCFSSAAIFVRRSSAAWFSAATLSVSPVEADVWAGWD